MNNWPALFCILPLLVCADPAAPKGHVTTLPMRYEGGTLPLGQGKTRATILENKVVFTQGDRKLAIPLENITRISCNTDVHRRFGALLLAAVPKLHLDTAEEYYVGLTGTGAGHDGALGVRIEGVFRLSGNDYGDFLAALERLTGQKAVDTHRVGAVVDYGL